MLSACKKVCLPSDPSECKKVCLLSDPSECKKVCLLNDPSECKKVCLLSDPSECKKVCLLSDPSKKVCLLSDPSECKKVCLLSDPSECKKVCLLSDPNHSDGQNSELKKRHIHNFTEEEIIEFRQKLLHWYDKNKRVLPWRQKAQDGDLNQRAYAVWVSEIMLQQTQVATVIDYYNRWMTKWPTVQDLATASLEEVNEMWSGLGYYSRGRRLLEGAKKVVEELEGEMPKTAESLLKSLPGVGRYTAGAIASIAYGEVTGLVDGNVIRVLSRIRMIGADSMSQPIILLRSKFAGSHANTIVDTERAGDFNQGLMELGATVCTPKSPSCEACPVQSLCLAFRKTFILPVLSDNVEFEKEKSAGRLTKTKSSDSNTLPDIECAADKCSLCIPTEESWDSSLGVQNYPRKGKKKAAREERTAVCIVCQNCPQDNSTKYFFTQRPEKGLLAGLWEFPSLKCEAEEDENFVVKSMLKNSCGLVVDSLHDMVDVGEVVHIFSHIHQTYIVKAATVNEGEVSDENCKMSTKWLTQDEMKDAAISTAMRKVYKAYELALSQNNNKMCKSITKNPHKYNEMDDMSIIAEIYK
ncbi:hypothetical protein KUTeg_016943 [Tegillarca granosa]|uniref:Adenine DNA glycosylase n=1 Tax=Tegillarca granosa TaxID=220873 RepID=A0ABQ9EMD5_TEGGR|nr:hypothetical protein KUTeg_016943 [Tegillarca granosa]